MQKLKEYKYIIIIALLVLGVAFYWYEWRPIQIRKECSRISQSSYELGSRFRTAINPFASPDERYQSCLRNMGL